MSATVNYSPAASWPVTTHDAVNGRCLSCILDFPDSGGMAAGRQAHVEALARRLVTERGTCIDDPDYGEDLLSLANADVTPRLLAEAEARVVEQFGQDDRTLSAACNLTFAGGVVLVAATVADRAGPFGFTLAVSDVTATLLKVG